MNLQDEIKKERPFIIAGPCSAESQDQVLQICMEIAQVPEVKMLRAGIWKPRTRPNSFEGLGEIALPWLVEAGKQTGLPTCTEVANKKHVESALKAGIDVLWVGARTTVNPFAVQEIADALKGIQIPVMIKNPVNPDLGLWMGAVERFENVGISDLTVIHRGFSVYRHDKYRNVPTWGIPIDFKEKMPHIPIICDPSHITGRRDLLLEVSQKSMDLNFDGLMIETHPNPDTAWSDAQQQVNAIDFKKIVQSLVLRSGNVQETILGALEEKRNQIKVLDDSIFQLLSDRMKLSEEVGRFKREHKITILQAEHWKKIIQNRITQKDDFGLTKEFIKQFMDAIHQESIRHQTKIMNQSSKNEPNR